MNYLFLDIDGVLNRDSTKEKSITGFTGLDSYLVKKFLDWYVDQENLSIVLSSTWRTDPVMVEEIKTAGIPLVGLTGDEQFVPYKYQRGAEIHRYMEDNPIDGTFVILDDNQWFFPHQLKHFVRTSPVHGLRDKDLTKVKKILDEKNK